MGSPGAWSTWAHRAALLVGVLVAFWATVEVPTEHQFELLMRRLDLTGQVLGPFNMLWTVLATLLFSLAAYAVVWLAARAIYRSLVISLGGAAPPDPGAPATEADAPRAADRASHIDDRAR